MNSDGVYWHISNCKNIKNKIIKELDQAKLESKQAYIARKKYINNYYKNISIINND
ncbi:hypothetical protein OAV30_01750 [Candidatus Pelagibacter sp.]|nr:hypothetical protein [Candidatus Pelagibacter sp.]